MCEHDVVMDVGKRIFQMNQESKTVTFEKISESLPKQQNTEKSSECNYKNDFQAEYARLRQITFEVEPTTTLTVRAGKEMRIPVNSEVLISGSLDGPWQKIEGPLIVQGCEQIAQKQSVRFANAIVNPEPEVPLRVINLSNEDQILHKGTVMAEYNEAEIWSDDNLPGQQVEGELDKSKKLFEDMVNRSTEGLDTYQGPLASAFLNGHKECNFIYHANDLGHTDIYPHKIDTGDSPPIHQGPRRLPMAKRQVADKEVK